MLHMTRLYFQGKGRKQASSATRCIGRHLDSVIPSESMLIVHYSELRIKLTVDDHQPGLGSQHMASGGEYVPTMSSL